MFANPFLLYNESQKTAEYKTLSSALVQLSAGESEVSIIDQNGTSSTYRQGDKSELNRLIRLLADMLGITDDSHLRRQHRAVPISFC